MDKIERKRDRLEIIYDMLKIIRDNHNSIKPTPLLRYSNLSSKSFSEYYPELLKKELIKEIIDNKGKKYITLTDNGFKYLEKYKLIHGFINEFNL
jgi:predicted transcriptional regulator